MQEFYQELYDSKVDLEPVEISQEERTEPPILSSEVRHVIKTMKPGKAPREDKITVDIFTSLPCPYRLLYSCTRQKGRKDSDGGVQDVGLRIPECLQRNTEKYKRNEGTIISNWYLRLNFIE